MTKHRLIILGMMPLLHSARTHDAQGRCDCSLACASSFFSRGVQAALALFLSFALAFAFPLCTPQSAQAKSLVLPSSYYLTNDGYVTPVKLQSPWGSCWAFAIASAIESSILKAEADSLTLARQATSSKGMDTPQLSHLNDSIDISERAIAWLSHEPQSEASAGAQAGEGFHLVNPDDPLAQLPEGSFSLVEAALTSWQLLVPEEKAPYQYNGYDGRSPWYSSGSDGADARSFDWSVDSALLVSEDLPWRVGNILHLESPARLSLNSDGTGYDYLGFDEGALINIKHALLDVGAVAISLEAELSIPSQVVRRESSAPAAHFSYDTWAQYNAKSTVAPNHALTIVGWDDAYSASNFHGTESGSPAGDGAWLCKNNWGSDALYASLGGASDATHWGLESDAGASGFFWLSYYDHSITDVTAFCMIDTEASADNIYQHDYVSASEFISPTSYNDEVKVANVFEANAPELLESVGAWTFAPNETVTTEIYLLPDDGKDILATPTFFTEEHLVSRSTRSLEDAGFHVIDLDDPIILGTGQRFALVQSVQGWDAEVMNADSSRGGEVYYLSLELAYTQNDPQSPQSAMAEVVSNPGETYVLLFGGEWAPVSDYNDWYADLKAQGNVPVDVIYGNALIKAYTRDTSMVDKAIIYETVKLS